MDRDQVFALLQEGLNEVEIAAAFNVAVPVARAVIDETLGRIRGATQRAEDRKAARWTST